MCVTLVILGDWPVVPVAKTKTKGYRDCAPRRDPWTVLCNSDRCTCFQRLRNGEWTFHRSGSSPDVPSVTDISPQTSSWACYWCFTCSSRWYVHGAAMLDGRWGTEMVSWMSRWTWNSHNFPFVFGGRSQFNHGGTIFTTIRLEFMPNTITAECG